MNRFEVLIDGVSQGNWSQNNASTTAGSGTGGEHQWQNLKLNFTAQSDATAIEIRETGKDISAGRGIRIDNIRITADTTGVPANTVRQIFEVAPTNDRPMVSGNVDLGEMDEDGCFRITAEQLLSKASDIDGDKLQVTDLKLSQGEGTIAGNGDGSWSLDLVPIGMVKLPSVTGSLTEN